MSWFIAALLLFIAFMIVRMWLEHRKAREWFESGPWASAGYRVPDLKDERRMTAIMRCFDELAEQKHLPHRDLQLAVEQGLVQHSEIQACLDANPYQVSYISDEKMQTLKRNNAANGDRFDT